MSTNVDIMEGTDSFGLENPRKAGPTGDQLRDVLAESGIVMQTPQGIEVARKYTREDGTIDEEIVYAELAQLIVEGNAIVRNMRYVDPNVEGTLSGMASVLASVRQMIGDFAKVHADFSKHKRQLEVEKFREGSKMRLLERKHQLDMEKIEAMRKTPQPEEDGIGKIGYSQTDMVRMINEVRSLPDKTL